MKKDRILYVDDSFENGLTAMAADPRIDFASGIKLIERPLRDYAHIITDMKMEHDESGMELVELGLKEGILPYVATGGTYEHGGTFNRVRLFDSGEVKVFDKMAKTDERFWRGALDYIEKNKNPTRSALEQVRATLGITLESTVSMLMNIYRENNRTSSQ